LSIRVNDFRWEPGKNDAEYIKLLESSRDEWQKIAQKAIAKLKVLSKAQEPRVLTLKEVEEIDGQIYLERDNGKAMWAFVWHNKNSTISFILDGHYEEYVDVLEKSTYGYRWRCWSAKPTDAERKAVAWGN